MSQQIIEPEQYHYTLDQKADFVVHSSRANKLCGDIRKQFNLCRGNVVGKFADPNLCKDSAIALINCFQNVTNVQSKCLSDYQQAKQCILSENQDCQQLLQKYQDC